ncbi:MAG TPA: amino acid-binding protein [Armatimonadota bacterium]|jgi:hypothetical protein
MALEQQLTKQVSVFLENKSGRLQDVCRELGQAGISIRALCIADTSDFGILRLIVNDPHGALQVLTADGFSVGETNVLAVQVPDRPGGLGSVLAHLPETDVNVEYMYAFFTRCEDQAVVVFRVGDDQISRVVESLEAGGVVIMKAEDVYAI